MRAEPDTATGPGARAPWWSTVAAAGLMLTWCAWLGIAAITVAELAYEKYSRLPICTGGDDSAAQGIESWSWFPPGAECVYPNGSIRGELVLSPSYFRVLTIALLILVPLQAALWAAFRLGRKRST